MTGMRHIMLTGEIQVGKSTAINRALAAAGIVPGGFRTVAGPGLRDGSDSIHIVRADGTENPSEENCVFRRGVPGKNGTRGFLVFPQVFETRGTSLLRPDRAKKEPLILMDEIGVREAQCRGFHDAVFRALNGGIPVLGVVQIRPGGFLQEVRDHPNVRLVTVTAENREQVARLLTQWLQGLKNGKEDEPWT